MFEKITKTLSGLAFIKYINSLIDYVNTSDIDATRIKGQLDISNIPPAGLDNVIKVDTVTDMLALTVDDVQNGDTVMIIGVTPPVQYQVVDDTKLGTMDAFQEYAAGTATKALADINGNNIHTTYGKLAGNNTWTGNNYWNGSAIFNANLTIRGSATTPGDVSTYLWLGTQPEGSEQTPSICRNKIGDLVMYAADYRPCYLRSGIQTSFASVYNSDGTVEFSSLNNTPWGKYTNANGLELTVNKTPTVNADVSNKKYVDDSIAEGTVYRSKSTITHPLQITKGNTIGQLKEAIVTLANKIKLLSQVTGCIGYFTCAETWAGNWTNDDFVLEAGQMWSVEIVSINSYSEGYWVARITSYSEKSCYIVSYTNLIWGNLHKYAFLTDVTSAVANLLSSNNTWTGSNTYRKNIAVSNGTTAGSQGQIILGIKPSAATTQANIISSTTGALNYIATENTGHYFKIGNNIASISITSNESETAIFSHNAFEFARITNVGVAKWLGNANTATKLQTARTINGVSFDGTANITIADSTKLPIAGGTMTGDLTLKGNPTADLMAATKKYVDDSIASAGGGDVLAAGNNSFTGANTFQNLVTMVGGAVFTSRTTTLAWKNATQTVATINASTYTGNSATATKLATARTITANLASGTAGSFDGSANITVGVTGTLPIANGGTGLTSAPSMLVNLASTTATSPLQASPRPGVTGTLPIANGGTGQTTAAGVRNALGLGNTTGAVPIANGGTGATTAAAARTALGCAPAYTYSTTDLTAGSSKLTTGTLYIVYE